MRRALIVVSTLIALALTAFSGSAAATPPETPNGFVGACNMVQAGGGMEHAMTVDNPNGNAGMGRAVTVSGGFCP